MRGEVQGVAVSGNYAYVADRDAGLLVIDISNPTNPQRVGGCDSWGGNRVAVSGNYAYVADGSAGFQVIDVSNPANPQRMGGYDTSGGAWGVAVSGNYAYVAVYFHGLEVIDVSNPASPWRIGGNSDSGCSDIQATADGRIFAAGQDGLTILQMSPFFRSITRTETGLELSWEGFGSAQLGRATRLENPDWTPLLGSEQTNRVTLPLWGGNEFFRLVKP
jgi:hypothetical protein